MNRFWKHLLVFVLLFSAGGSLFPQNAQAAACTCYFGTYNDCLEIYVDDDHTNAICLERCKAEVGSNFKNAQFTTDWVSEVNIEFLCSVASSEADSKREAAAKVAATGKTTGPSDGKIKIETLTPKLNVDIPGLKFSPVKLANDVVESGFIGEYISAVYKYLIFISVTLAIIMVMVGGLQYAFGAVTQDQISKAKKRIKNGIIGLVLLLSAVMILNLVNPQLTNPTSLKLKIVKEEQPEVKTDPGDVAFSGTAICKSKKDCENWCGNNPDPSKWPTSNDKTIDPKLTKIIPSSTGLTNRTGRVKATDEMIAALQRAGKIAVGKDSSYSIMASSGYRPLKTQIKIVCNRFKISDPKARAIAIAGIGGAVAYPGKSNHGSGNAVDLRLYKGGKLISMSGSMSGQRQKKWEQGARIFAEIMGEAGMVRYTSEIWHFELKGKTTTRCRCTGAACPFPPPPPKSCNKY